MVIELPDTLFSNSMLTEQSIKLHLAIALYKEEILTLGQAATLAGLPQLIFQKELGKRKIPVHYGVEELKIDLKHLNFV
jgi:predicted HTH domain antitoxin